MASAPARSVRGRRASRPSGDDREGAILATAERLLGERALRAISIDDLARGAGISRPTFYFYFPSKDAVLLALLDRVVREADEALAAVPDTLAADPSRFWRECIATYHRTFGAHAAVTLACAEVRLSNAEVGALWSRVMESWTQAVTAAVEGERERGTAPAGLPARDLAIALVSMNERVLYSSFAHDVPTVDERDVVDVLHTVWLNAIYQTTTPPTGSSRPDR
ncbi:TetR/AcrR family transcriptional regulator [Actinophytocola gossypii]|uniref:TetR/AcrR family transcriptional regulator n=1 Tax=Actinophytocola gossypii TaxID=2812003 RepID=A0ABT2J7F5_9PSEU|nr:TetR/AcrR family transcriptional regulator [Actinophytocola gossypii]MCT2583783.1 TetR/AcrR family transcriptional regulator [Actinophytocola gossypii]